MDDGHRRMSADNSIISGFLKEWNLFWENIGSQDEEASLKLLSPLAELSQQDIKTLIKSLSSHRKQLNVKLERIKKEIDLNSVKRETLRLVGGSEEETAKKLDELADVGQSVSLELDRLNRQLALARQREEELIQQLKLGQDLPDIE